jgi:predicted PurR-regulated permease PerM
MSLERQILFWAVAFAALLFLLHLLGSVVAPFAAGIALGYLLDPLVRRLQRFGLNRLGASLLILIAFIFVATVALIVVIPALGSQLMDFARRLPDLVTKFGALATEFVDSLSKDVGAGWLGALGLSDATSTAQIQKSVADLMAQGGQWLLGALRSVVSGGAAVFNFLSLLLLTPVVAFYILVDWNTMVGEIDSWLPRPHRARIRKIAGEINAALAGFLRGQSLVCLFLGLWYGVGLTLVGLDFGLLIGVFAGVLSFVPYVGSLSAFVLAAIVALVQGWPSLRPLGEALGVVIAGQLLEGYVLSPKLVGDSIGLHPVWLMFALMAFGALFGFVGLIVAVPTAAAIGVLARHALAAYLASPLYGGETPRA